MDSADCNLGARVVPVDTDSLLRQAFSHAWWDGPKTEDVYTGGILRLDIHMDGDCKSNFERIESLRKTLATTDLPVDTPFGSGKLIAGKLFSSRLSLYRDEITHAHELALVGAVSILEKQNDRDELVA